MPERTLDAALQRKRLHVHVRRNAGPVQLKTLRFRQHVTALGDEPVAVPYHVHGRFPETRRGVHVYGLVASRGGQDEVLAVLRFADDDVRSREIGEYGRPRQRRPAGRRDRHPVVFADCRVDHHPGIIRAQEHVGSERHVPSAEGYILGLRFRRPGEVPCLVEFAVLGKIGLGRYRQDFPAAAGHRDVEDRVVQPQRHAEAEGQVMPLRAGEQGFQALQGAFQQCLGVEEVGAGIAGETQFGEKDV